MATRHREVPADDRPLALRYLGPGWIVGLPARNVTANERAALDPALVAEGLALGLYEEVTDAGTEEAPPDPVGA
jgi:hypothetical protein